MTDETPNRNIALLIDADNASAATLDPVLTVLAELGTVNVRRVYGNWSKPALKGWRDMTVKHGIEPQQQFDLTKGKNATDMKMTIDAMDLLFRGASRGSGSCRRTATSCRWRCGSGRRACRSTASARRRRPRRSSRPARASSTSARCRRGRSRRRCPSPVEVPLAESLPPRRAGRAQAARGAKRQPIDAELRQAADRRLRRGEARRARLSSACRRWASSPPTDRASTRATMAIKRLSDLIEAVPNFQTERRDDGRLSGSSVCDKLQDRRRLRRRCYDVGPTR